MSTRLVSGQGPDLLEALLGGHEVFSDLPAPDPWRSAGRPSRGPTRHRPEQAFCLGRGFGIERPQCRQAPGPPGSDQGLGDQECDRGGVPGGVIVSLGGHDPNAGRPGGPRDGLDEIAEGVTR